MRGGRSCSSAFDPSLTIAKAPLWRRRPGLDRVVAYPTPLVLLTGDKAIAEFLERLHAVHPDSGATFRAEEPG